MEPLFTYREGWKRIYLDLPGHGQSPVDESIANHDQVLDILFAFLAEVIPGETFAVAGESRGAFLARGIVHRRPELVDGALLIVPGRHAVAPEGSVPERQTLVRADELIPELAESEVGRFEALVIQSRNILEKIRSFKIPAVDLADQAFQARMDANYDFSFDIDQPEETFGKPALVLAGRQDSMVGYREACKMIEIYPRGTFAILDRAGHGLGWEQEELFLALAQDWLKRVEEFAA